VMLGYWGDRGKSSDAIDASGWLKTGDIAEIKEGRVHIQRRLNDVIVLSTGEKINPNDVETAVRADPLVDHVSVVGNGRPCLCMIASLNHEQWRLFAEASMFDPQSPNLIEVAASILQRFNGLLLSMPKHSIARALHLTLEPWSAKNGILTPTLKVKRAVIEQRYQEEIAALYEQLDRRI